MNILVVQYSEQYSEQLDSVRLPWNKHAWLNLDTLICMLGLVWSQLCNKRVWEEEALTTQDLPCSVYKTHTCFLSLLTVAGPVTAHIPTLTTSTLQSSPSLMAVCVSQHVRHRAMPATRHHWRFTFTSWLQNAVTSRGQNANCTRVRSSTHLGSPAIYGLFYSVIYHISVFMSAFTVEFFSPIL